MQNKSRRPGSGLGINDPDPSAFAANFAVWDVSRAEHATGHSCFSPKEIIGSSHPCPDWELSYIYFLIDGGDIVYVGRASTIANLWSRLTTHRKEKRFDHYSWLSCARSEVELLEAEYILKFDPLFNKKRPDLFISLKTLTARLRKKNGARWSASEVRRLLKLQFGINCIAGGYYDRRELQANGVNV